MALDDAGQKAFDFAQDAAKQIIALSTGILTLTITFFKDFAAGGSETARDVMIAAWILFVLSVLLGIAQLLALTGQLKLSDPTVYAANVRVLAGAQQVVFIVAIIVAVWAGAIALNAEPEPVTPATATKRQ